MNQEFVPTCLVSRFIDIYFSIVVYCCLLFGLMGLDGSSPSSHWPLGNIGILPYFQSNIHFIQLLLYILFPPTLTACHN